MERKILIGLIISSPYCVAFYKMYNKDYIKSKICRRIIKWIKKYFEKYERAPAQDIERIFESHSRDNVNKSELAFIEDVLASISEEFEREGFNHQFYIDQTVSYFKEQALENLSDDILTFIESGDIAGAEVEVTNFKLPKDEKTDGFYLLDDEDAVKEAYEEDLKPLFAIPGILGLQIGDEFTRDSFVAILAPEKRGKSWLLQQLSMWALRAKCNVALFNVGDMSKSQVVRRYTTSVNKKSYKQKFCNEHLYPVLDCIYNQNNTCDKDERTCEFGIFENESPKQVRAHSYDEITELISDNKDYSPCAECKKGHGFSGAVWYKTCKEETPLTWKTAIDGMRKKTKRWGKLKVSVHPGDTLAVSDIKNTLDRWEKEEDLIIDVVIVDYIDILAAENNRLEGRDRINQTWKLLRSLSIEKHICVIGATQADAAAQEAHTLGTSNFTDDKRKFGHVTAFYGLNQTEDERKKKIIRVNSLMVRDDEKTSKQVSILQDLNRGIVHLDSF